MHRFRGTVGSLRTPGESRTDGSDPETNANELTDYERRAQRAYQLDFAGPIYHLRHGELAF